MTLNEQDVQGMLRLVAEVAGMQGPMPMQRMLRGISKLTAATIALSAEMTFSPGKGDLHVTSANACGLPEGDHVHFDARLHPTTMRDMVLQGIAPMVNRLQGALSTAASMSEDAFGALMRRQMGIGNYACSVRKYADSSRFHLLAVCRTTGESFVSREEEIVALMHEHVERLGARVEVCLSVASGLPPYLARIVPELLAGAGEKQIAAKLGFTFNTTHQYIKAIYKRMGVSSRAEFMARCMHQGSGQAVVAGGALPEASPPTFFVSRNPQAVGVPRA